MKKLLVFLFLAGSARADVFDFRIKIEEQTEVGRFSDALYRSVEDGNAIIAGDKLKEQEYLSERQGRIDRYVDAVKNPPPPPEPKEPTKEELQQVAEALAAEITAKQEELQKVIEEIGKKDNGAVSDEIEIAP